MNLKRMGRISGFVAAVAMLAMVLQGCGSDGDGGSGISQDMYDALQAELDVAEAAQMTAEDAAAAAMTAQTMAETARDAALEAQMTAEAARDAALEAQAMAMTEAADAMAAEAAAEMARQAAVTAQQIAAQAEMDARAAEMAAQTALEAAETMRDMYQQGQMDAEAERDMYMQAAMDAETAADAAEAAQMTADNARIAAETALAVAKQAEMDAVQARMEAETARDDYKDKLATANEEIEKLKMAMMDADDAADAAAEAAQRARVDATSIQRSSGVRIAKDLDGDGEIERSIIFDLNDNGNTDDEGEDAVDERSAGTTMPMVNYQGSQPRPTDMKLTASHDGSMVTFKATQRTGRDVETLIDLTVPAGTGSTSGMTVVEGLPGGHDKDITLMTDIMSPVLRAFGNNVPAGLDPLDDTGETPFDPVSQTSRYPVLARTYDSDSGAPSIAANADATVAETRTNLDLDAFIKVTLGSFAPTDAVPDPTVQAGAMLPGSYAGVDGSFRCALPTGTCAFDIEGGETIMVGAWEFVPAAANVQIADSDFLVFGAWIKRPQSQVGVGYSAGISSASAPYDNNGATEGINLDAVEGKATYSGHAAGHFAERFIGTDEAKSGRFTATAELNADFGTSDDDSVGTISGSITDFVRDDGVDANWVVSLMKTNLDDADTAMPGGFVNGDTGGHAAGANWTGQWGVELAGAAGNAQHPSGVVGTFGAAFGSPVDLTDELDLREATADEGFVGVIGGFGARKVTE